MATFVKRSCLRNGRKSACHHYLFTGDCGKKSGLITNYRKSPLNVVSRDSARDGQRRERFAVDGAAGSVSMPGQVSSGC